MAHPRYNGYFHNKETKNTIIECCASVIHSIDNMEEQFADLEEQEIDLYDFTVKELEAIAVAYDIIYTKMNNLKNIGD